MTDQTEPQRPERRYNWLRLYTVLPRNPKWVRLSSDSVRVAYIHALLAAREELVRGEFLDRSYLEAALGPVYAVHVDELVASTLLVEDDDGTVRVRQYDLWQPIDEGSAKRVAEYRRRQREAQQELERRREADRVRKANERARKSGKTGQDTRQDTFRPRSVTSSVTRPPRDIPHETVSRVTSAQRGGREEAEAEAETEAEASTRRSETSGSLAPLDAPLPSPTCRQCHQAIDDPRRAAKDGDGVFHYPTCPA